MKQRPDSIYIGAILACVGGYMDGYSYLLRDGAFATMQTGNMIYTVLSLTGYLPDGAMKYLLSIVAFSVGVMVAVQLQRHMGTDSQWQQRILLLEIGLLLVVGCIPLGRWNLLANVIISFVAAMQTQSFKTMGNHAPYATTMCSGNLRSFSEQCCTAYKDPQARVRCLQYLLIITCFVSGVFFATCVTPVGGASSVWFGALGLCVPCWYINPTWINRKEARHEH
ncbi:YoaK family protein [Bengtsoniella intestinalis]|uniref:YoaK family protein n=1 Tax=Bengtsoniella intestinalis TaxID=3073143 RepID=UPI00391F7653